MTPQPPTLQSRIQSEDDLRWMLNEARRLKDEWEVWLLDPECRNDKKTFIEAARNYNALKGVIRTIEWVLRFPQAKDPLW